MLTLHPVTTEVPHLSTILTKGGIQVRLYKASYVSLSQIGMDYITENCSLCPFFIRQ